MQESYGARDPDSQLKNTDYNVVVMSDGTVIWIPAIRVKVDSHSKYFMSLENICAVCRWTAPGRARM